MCVCSRLLEHGCRIMPFEDQRIVPGRSPSAQQGERQHRDQDLRDIDLERPATEPHEQLGRIEAPPELVTISPSDQPARKTNSSAESEIE